MKAIFFTILVISLLDSHVYSQNSAISSYMDFDKYLNNGDILVRTVRAAITTKTTYYCTFMFNAGDEGGGYAGIQDSPDNGQTFYYIFSLWDPSNHQKITAPYIGPGTKVENFGGEGTGLKSWNGQLGWRVGDWYTLALRRWDSNQHTLYGYWVNDVRNSKWTHLVTLDYPVANVYFNGGVGSFLEDWTDTGANVRRFELKDGYKRTSNGVWYPMNPLRFSINSGDAQPGKRSYNYRYAYDAGISNGAFYYQTGGNTRNTCPSHGILTNNQPNQPQNPIIYFYITQATNNLVQWNVPSSSTPQFKYTVKINGYVIASVVDPERRYQYINCRSNDKVEVIIEDILGRTSTQSRTVN